MSDNNNLRCPGCQRELVTSARGRDIRIYACSQCLDEQGPTLYLRETMKLKAIRPLTKGALIDLSTKSKPSNTFE